jgi:hypothetical protein
VNLPCADLAARALIRFGIDFDGTLALHDELFHRLARERFAMPESVGTGKSAIRAWFRSQPGGGERWIELQGMAYGTHMHEAAPAPGCREFLGRCADGGVPVVIVSHKTEFPVIGPRVKLREQSSAWLEQHGFFEAGSGLGRGNVFFEATRGEKIGRIVDRGCTHFIDDLPEVFADPAFPRSVHRWLYAASGADNGARGFRTWDDMRAELEKLLGKQRVEH